MSDEPSPSQLRAALLEAISLELRAQAPATLAEAKRLADEIADQEHLPSLPFGLIADLYHLVQSAKANHGRAVVRPAITRVAIGLGALGTNGALGVAARLRFELIEGAGCTGIPYPGREAYRLTYDEEWNGALCRARDLAAAHQHPISSDTDVRWTLVDLYDRPLPPSTVTRLQGSSAGGAFLAGFVALHLMRRNRITISQREALENLVPLFNLPEGDRLDNQLPLRSLEGDSARRKMGLPWGDGVRFVLTSAENADANRYGHIVSDVRMFVELINGHTRTGLMPPTPRPFRDETWHVLDALHTLLGKRYTGKVARARLETLLSQQGFAAPHQAIANACVPDAMLLRIRAGNTVAFTERGQREHSITA